MQPCCCSARAAPVRSCLRVGSTILVDAPRTSSLRSIVRPFLSISRSRTASVTRKAHRTASSQRDQGQDRVCERRYPVSRRSRRSARCLAGEAARAFSAGACGRTYRWSGGDPGRCAYCLCDRSEPQGYDGAVPVPRRFVLSSSETVIDIPSLRMRDGDSLLLARVFLMKFTEQQGKSAMQFAEDAIEAIEGHGWPGTFRQLENAIKRAVIMADGNLNPARGSRPRRRDREAGSGQSSAGSRGSRTEGRGPCACALGRQFGKGGGVAGRSCPRPTILPIARTEPDLRSAVQ